MTTTLNKSDRVLIFDTTLRDSEQMPGARMALEQKLRVAAALQLLRVDVIEAGFPAASPGEFETVRSIARVVHEASVCCFARAQRTDLDRAWAAVQDAERPRLHVFLATGQDPCESRPTREDILRRAEEGVLRAREYCPDVEFSCGDAARTEPAFLSEVVEKVIAAGATTVNLLDAVGSALPDQTGALIAMLKKSVRNIDQVVLSVHCHDDLGLAVANSLAAVQAGARQVECAINGVGERAGNAALEEVVLALQTRADFFKVHTGVRTEQLCAASRAVSRATGLVVPRNKAVVGQDALGPEDVGRRGTSLGLTRHSDRPALRLRLEQLGYALDAAQLDALSRRFMALAEVKKEVFDADLETLVEDLEPGGGGRWQLVNIHAVAASHGAPSAAVCLKLRDGRQREDAAVGAGPVDAAFKCIARITGTQVRVKSFAARSLTAGQDAQGEVLIEVEHEGRVYRGRAVGTDLVVASAHAFLEVVNAIAAQRTPELAVDPGEVQCGAV